MTLLIIVTVVVAAVLWVALTINRAVRNLVILLTSIAHLLTNITHVLEDIHSDIKGVDESIESVVLRLDRIIEDKDDAAEAR